MFKYWIRGEVCEAKNLDEAKARVGWVHPQEVDPKNHFIVRIWNWDEDEEDFIVENLGEAGHRVFRHYRDALDWYRRLALDIELRFQVGEVKIDLVHFHFGEFKPVLSRVLFPGLLVAEP